MKRITTAILSVALLVCGAGCSQAEPAGSSVSTPSSVASEPMPPPHTSESSAPISRSDDPVIGSAITISEQQQAQLVTDILESMEKGIMTLMHCWYGLEFDEEAEPIIRYYEQREYPYYPVTDYQTKDELFSFLLRYFTQGCIDGLIVPTVDTGNPSTEYPFTVQPVFIEENGRLYTSPYPSGGGIIGYFTDSINIVEADEAGGYISATHIPNGEVVDGKMPEGERIDTEYLRVSYERGRWVLDSFGDLNFWNDDPFASQHMDKVTSEKPPYVLKRIE